ncbi:hypothetical protein GKZ89_07360 [Bacillus mangrovi]|uniref:UPF0738 protein GKZ89_07360 n=1 Tax=Metabacillus mangrovi TaxID=1491830 RepID=A0A7X2S4R9_9BACI|nr:hypothetical protein [Metabacillus mangrovi]
MNKRIEVIEAAEREGKLLLYAEKYDGHADRLEAKGQILADSDQLAFIYILEDPEHFTYVSISPDYWQHLEHARQNSVSVWAVINEEELELLSFHEELTELVQNISGNANYGDEMEGRVSGIFAG